MKRPFLPSLVHAQQRRAWWEGASAPSLGLVCIRAASWREVVLELSPRAKMAVCLHILTHSVAGPSSERFENGGLSFLDIKGPPPAHRLSWPLLKSPLTAERVPPQFFRHSSGVCLGMQESMESLPSLAWWLPLEGRALPATLKLEMTAWFTCFDNSVPL